MRAVGAKIPGNEPVQMRRSYPRKENNFAPRVEETPEVWRITWAMNKGSNETQMYATREGFEKALFRLALEAESRIGGVPESVKLRWWEKLVRRREGQGSEVIEGVRHVKEIVRVERLNEQREWELYSYGFRPPVLLYERQENR